MQTLCLCLVAVALLVVAVIKTTLSLGHLLSPFFLSLSLFHLLFFFFCSSINQPSPSLYLILCQLILFLTSVF